MDRAEALDRKLNGYRRALREPPPGYDWKSALIDLADILAELLGGGELGLLISKDSDLSTWNELKLAKQYRVRAAHPNAQLSSVPEHPSPGEWQQQASYFHEACEFVTLRDIKSKAELWMSGLNKDDDARTGLFTGGIGFGATLLAVGAIAGVEEYMESPASKTQVEAALRIKAFARLYSDDLNKTLSLEELALFVADAVRLLPSEHVLDNLVRDLVLDTIRRTELRRRGLTDKTQAGWMTWLMQSAVEERRSGRTDRWLKRIGREIPSSPAGTTSSPASSALLKEDEFEGRIVKNVRDRGYAFVKGPNGTEYFLHYTSCDDELRRRLERLPSRTQLRIVFRLGPDRGDQKGPPAEKARLAPKR
jgi:hypothetical protein